MSDPDAREGAEPPPPDEPRPAHEGAAGRDHEGVLPPRPARGPAESLFVRVGATAGVVGLSTAVAAILGTQDVAAWTIGLVVSLICVILAGLLWRSRTL